MVNNKNRAFSRQRVTFGEVGSGFVSLLANLFALIESNIVWKDKDMEKG